MTYWLMRPPGMSALLMGERLEMFVAPVSICASRRWLITLLIVRSRCSTVGCQVGTMMDNRGRATSAGTFGIASEAGFIAASDAG